MQNSLYVGLTAQLALSRRLDTIADNVANMNSVGYRASGVSFETEVAQTGGRSTAFAAPGAEYLSRRAGALVRTDNQLDVAIQGEGWFAVKTAYGTAYTRDGRMRISEAGALETLDGSKVLDAGASPIAIKPNQGLPVIAEDGMITQNGRQVGAIGLFTIDGDAELTRYENSAVAPSKPAKPTLDFVNNRIIQGWIEQSNVSPVQEISKLISITRAFDAVSGGMSQIDTTLQEAIKTLGGRS